VAAPCCELRFYQRIELVSGQCNSKANVDKTGGAQGEFCRDLHCVLTTKSHFTKFYACYRCTWEALKGNLHVLTPKMERRIFNTYRYVNMNRSSALWLSESFLIFLQEMDKEPEEVKEKEEQERKEEVDNVEVQDELQATKKELKQSDVGEQHGGEEQNDQTTNDVDEQSAGVEVDEVPVTAPPPTSPDLPLEVNRMLLLILNFHFNSRRPRRLAV